MRIPILPLILGLSACTVGGALVYQYLKQKREKSNDEDELEMQDVLDRSVQTSPPTPQIIIEQMTVANEFIPVIVGRNSLSLKSLEGKTGTKINFEEKDEDNQLCKIKGSKQSVDEAIKIITQIISKPVIVTEEIEVSQSACGKIIGRCGEMLQEICRKSMAKVSVNSGDVQKRQVIITGTRSQVNAARALVEEKIREDQQLRKALEESELKREKRVHLKSMSSSTNSLNDSVSPGGSLVSKAEKLSAGGAAGGQMEVYVSAIASPSKFWLQMVGPQSTELDTLIERMTEYYSQADNQQLHEIQEPYLDQIVAAMFKWDNKWYRAKIVAILPNDFNESNMVLDIYFLDYGDSAYVNPNEVYQLRTDFLTLRFQAIECFLANVAPPEANTTETKYTWDRKAVERFEELTHVAQWEMLLCRVVCHEDRSEKRSSRESSPVPGVELYDSINGRDINVAQELIDDGLAVEVSKLATLTSSRLKSSTNSRDSSRNLSPVGFTNGIGVNGAVAGSSSHRHPQDELQRFSAICENSSNENFENARKNGNLQQFLSEERQTLK